jgi:carboxyltransferase family protein
MNQPSGPAGMRDHPAGLSTANLVRTVLDTATWRSWDEPLQEPSETDAGYRSDLEQARARTGIDESVLTGDGRIGGYRVAIVLCEFAFLGGSIGVRSGERLTRAVERATRERLPLLASPASAGTRMQEGTVAFLQMVKVTAAIAEHRAAALPYLVYLRHPTTGGVLASWDRSGISPPPSPEHSSASSAHGSTRHCRGTRSRPMFKRPARGVVDRIIAEQPDAADAPAAFLKRVGDVLEYELVLLQHENPTTRLARRRARYRAIGLT